MAYYFIKELDENRQKMNKFLEIVGCLILENSFPLSIWNKEYVELMTYQAMDSEYI